MKAGDWLVMAELCLDLAESWPAYERLSTIDPGPDGYGRGGVGVRSAGTANPTAAVVVALAGGRDEASGDRQSAPDTWAAQVEWTGMLVDHLFAQARLMGDHARRVASLRRLIDNRADGRSGRVSSLQGDCLACEKPVAGVGHDRLKSGYCPACWSAWVRYRFGENRCGREANHEQFRKRRRRQLDRAEDRAS